VLLLLGACSPGAGDRSGPWVDGGTPPAPSSDGSAPLGDGSIFVIDPDSGGSSTDAGACQSASANARIDTAYLAFAFDVSGSMGKGDEEWHDRTLKWDPVVAATKAFFQDAMSRGFSASLTFFPEGGGDEDVRCVDANYVVPDVPMTELPSPAFGTALDVIGAQDWRGGTPTLHVMNGVLQYVRQQRTTNPGNYAVVLVTDGYPQDCPDNSIQSVVNVASAAAADQIPTYVIGVNNPPISGAPDTVTNLGQIAVGGGTAQAFIIDTGDPTQTTADFKAVVDQIRSVSVACTIAIPPPPTGKQFDKQKVRVIYAGNQGTTELGYDASCQSASAWHYDNPDNPTQIVLCDGTCTAVQSDPTASLDVEFACEVVIAVM
jgi:hypothetical protein